MKTLYLLGLLASTTILACGARRMEMCHMQGKGFCGLGRPGANGVPCRCAPGYECVTKTVENKINPVMTVRYDHEVCIRYDQVNDMADFDEEEDYDYEESLHGRRMSMLPENKYNSKIYPCVSRSQRKVCHGSRYRMNCKCYTPPPTGTRNGCGRGYTYKCLKNGQCNCFSTGTGSTALHDAMCKKYGGRFCK